MLQEVRVIFFFLILICILKSFQIRHEAGYYFSNRTRHAYEWVRMKQGRKKEQEVQREDKWRRVTMVALFLDDKKTNDDGDGKENGKK